MKEKFKLALNITKSKFPNAKLCYLASRIYGGYDETLGHPEPYAYYQGWAVKELIEDQINGDPELTYTGEGAKAPWLSWGSYLWADGVSPRSDGLTWNCSADFEDDGRHPSTLGEQKVASLVLNELLNDETAIPWLFENPTAVPGSAGNLPARFRLANYPNPFNPSTTIAFELPEESYARLTVYNDLGQEVQTLLHGRLEAGTHKVAFDAAERSGGVYFYVLLAGDRNAVGKMILLK
jgi:hypothetical protein